MRILGRQEKAIVQNCYSRLLELPLFFPGGYFIGGPVLQQDGFPLRAAFVNLYRIGALVAIFVPSYLATHAFPVFKGVQLFNTGLCA